MLPLTCYNCGKPIGELEERYEEMTSKNKENNIKHILDSLGVKKICCRYLFLCHINECKILKTDTLKQSM